MFALWKLWFIRCYFLKSCYHFSAFSSEGMFRFWNLLYALSTPPILTVSQLLWVSQRFCSLGTSFPSFVAPCFSGLVCLILFSDNRKDLLGTPEIFMSCTPSLGRAACVLILRWNTHFLTITSMCCCLPSEKEHRLPYIFYNKGQSLCSLIFIGLLRLAMLPVLRFNLRPFVEIISLPIWLQRHGTSDWLGLTGQVFHLLYPRRKLTHFS